MTKLGAPQTKTPSDHLDGGLFFGLMARAAEITRKDFQYDLRVSKTLVDGWFNGDKLDPFERARRTVMLYHKKRRPDLVATILAYIAGKDDFDGRVLTGEQNAALISLTKLVMGSDE